MKKYILPLCLLAAFLMGGISSCSDVDDIQDMVLARILSPTNMSARLNNNLNIIVSWDEMSGADYYELEAYADTEDYGERTPDASSTVTAALDTLTGLIGETTYYIRVRAIDEDDSSRNSNWSTISRTTGSEQNMNAVKSGDIGSTYVTVTWTAGIDVDAIICAPTSSNSTANTVTYTLTSSDIANGSATITGLTPETSYKASLKLGEKTRGTATFTTTLDLSGATVLTTDDDWYDAISSAAEGTLFALAPGTYSSTSSKLKINSSVTLAAQDPSDLPVLNTCIQVYGGASLYLFQMVMDGTDTDGSQAIEYKEEGAYSELTIEGCEIMNYTKGLVYINVAAVIDDFTITNCIIHDVECSGGDFIDSRKGGWNTLNLTQSTIYNSANKRDVIRVDDASSSVSATVSTTIDKCTFYDVGNGGANYRIFYVRFAGNTNKFTNNVVANFNNKRGFANNASTGIPTFSNNYYYNCSNLMSLADGNSEAPTCFDEEGTELTEDPFADAANADFSITDELLQSYEFGDPRWY